MNEQKKYTIYTEADIQKYLSGGMSNPEMHAIEKAAMEDHLLAEAIEGYEAMEQKDWSKDLAALKDKLNASENIPLAPVYSFRKWWRVAAAAIILTSGIAVTYLFNKNKAKDTTAIAQVTVADSEPGAKADSTSAINSIAANEISKNSEIRLPAIATETATAKKENTFLATLKKEKKPDSNFIYKPSAGEGHNKDIGAASNANEYAYTKNAEIFNTNKGYNNNQPNEANANKALGIQNQATNAASNFINAQVVTADDKPVAFANVSVQKNKQPVYTDAKGNFKLPATDTVISGVVTSAGYISKKFSFKNSATENKIVLLQDSIELIQITAARSKSAAKPELQKNIGNVETDEDEDDAEPSIGWVEYNNYINDNLVFPNEAKEKNIHGVVEVFVKLKNNGDISQVKVDKSLCPKCDAEAIRLVKEGPKWDVKNNKVKKAKVKIRF